MLPSSAWRRECFVFWAVPTGRVWAADLGAHAGERVRLLGWLHHVRELKRVAFLLLRDGSGIAQVVVEESDERARLAGLPPESTLAVAGEVVAVAQAPGGVELHRPRIEVLSQAIGEPPVELHRPLPGEGLPTRLDHAAVALRHPRVRAAHRLTAAVVEGFRATLRAHRFVEIATPKLVGTATEGGANVFPVDYFGGRAYLAQSPQLYKQLMVGAFERVFETGPVFRAEPHDTGRHLSQFLSLDAEMGFIRDHEDVMAMVTAVTRGMAAAAAGCAAEVALLGVEPPAIPASSSIPAIHFADALELVSAATGEDLREEPDLAPAHERWLGEWAKREHGSDFLFVTGYPMVKRPFYTHPDPARPAYSNSFDLLFRGQEVVTGGQRLHHLADYERALATRGIPADAFAGYLEAFAHGMPPHGGFALGAERWVARLTGAANIRETTLFPRDRQRLTP
jgi:nondiscriminating aspartyl-tRNA synthetase